jgi:hypothetical protein
MSSRPGALEGVTRRAFVTVLGPSGFSGTGMIPYFFLSFSFHVISLRSRFGRIFRQAAFRSIAQKGVLSISIHGMSLRLVMLLDSHG